ncbi:hypothetical protein [Arthrobacter ginkgonis]
MRIVSAERITRGGLGGFFASRYFEVTAVPGPASSAVLASPVAGDPAADVRLPGHMRPGGPVSPGALAALLDAADAGDGAVSGVVPDGAPGGVAAPPVSTVAPEFDRLLAGLEREVGGSKLPGPGQILLLAGVRDDALRGAKLLSRATALEGVCTYGVLRTENLPRWGGEAASLRAPGPLVVALGLGSRWDALAQSMVGRVPADAIWAVVDAGRKPEDTRAWVEGLCGAGPVGGIVVVGEKGTATPHTPAELGLPILLAGNGELAPGRD